MPTWIFEPGHTEAEFRARHMMVTWVRGLFKDIRGSSRVGPRALRADVLRGAGWTRPGSGAESPTATRTCAAPTSSTSDTHPDITFEGRFSERVGDNDFKALAAADDARHHA